MMRGKRKTVFVALSGGVDSSVAAALLLEQGYEVVPVFLKWWEPDVDSYLQLPPAASSQSGCPWQADQEAAFAVAEYLGIAAAFRTWNFSQEFTTGVLQPLIEAAQCGRTGNPDVDCNRVVKFGAFLDRALAEGADYVATGHYARVRSLASSRLEPASYELLRARCDAKNDQTYFLWQLTQTQLSRVLFPIGAFESKEAVRQEARRRGLPTADRKSTRGICGIDKRNYPSGYSDFLGQYLPAREGEIVTTSGRVVGIHRGVARYTLGQRQKIGVTVDGGPYYVVAKNEETNRLIVAPPAEAQSLWQDEVVIGDVHWISGRKPAFPLQCEAFIRHPQHDTVPCIVFREKTRNLTQKNAKTFSRDFASHSATFRVAFERPQWAPTPGQSVVFYRGDVVLGGGVLQ